LGDKPAGRAGKFPIVGGKGKGGCGYRKSGIERSNQDEIDSRNEGLSEKGI